MKKVQTKLVVKPAEAVEQATKAELLKPSKAKNIGDLLNENTIQLHGVASSGDYNEDREKAGS